MPPQPSPIVPQKRDVPALQVIGTQFVATHRPEPLHVCVPEHPPQSIARPQPSPTLPQYLPVGSMQASGVQFETTQIPPSHIWPVGQLPQSSMPKQPLPMTPQ